MERKVTQVEFIMPKQIQTTRVAAYARVSSGKDAMLHSLSAQVSYYSNLIQNHKGWLYSGVYSDEAKTGTKDTRKAFQRLIADCKSGKIDMIITKSISRFARNTVTLLQTIRELKEIGVDVYFEEQRIHTMSSGGELLLTILASYAQEESRSVSENCKWRKRRNFEQGIAYDFRVYGYDMVDKNLVLNKEQAAVVKTIFEMYVGGCGSKIIADTLNERKTPAPQGDIWHQKSVIEIIKNEKYVGDLLMQKYYTVNHLSKKQKRNKGELKMYLVSDNHEPIIDRETFNTAQAILAERNKRNPFIKSYDYRFKGMVFCSKCEAKYMRKKVHTGTPSEHFIWKCATYTKKGKKFCANKQIPDDILCRLADAFEKKIDRIIIHPGCKVQFVFSDGSNEVKYWEIDRKWTDEMKERNERTRLS